MRMFLACIALVVMIADLDAGCRGGRRGGRRGGSCGSGSCGSGSCEQLHYPQQVPATCPCGPNCPCPQGPNCPAGTCPVPTAPIKKEGVKEEGKEAKVVQIAVLEEVNAVRARRGLRPFLRDAQLEAAAIACATIRAERLIEGHLSNDFSALPAGARAAASGCAAWEPSMGWGACCTYDNYTYAGAAYRLGRDGRRYMHLFVR